MSNRSRILSALFVTSLLAVAPACASHGVFDRYPTPNARLDNRAYANGYEAGRVDGENDARRGRPFDYNRNGNYRSADRGYGGYGNRNEYRQVFRQGFASGYDEGYRRYAQNDRNNRNDRNGYPGRGPNVYDGRQDGRATYRSPAAANGFRDGYSQGREDAGDGDRYDPVRASRYRDGDEGYNSRDGSRDAYKREYRDAFQQGYDRGYRELRGR